ncbi:putative Sporulation domain protein [Magnetofaba australis IT-1]|uniref:Putative Sporulation domain protein n=2 Tax=Magnetofaba TaxID=1472292 RepID=A0A1Y2K8Q6_9PROT|nr:putative Sporulation domain protein [Magnetofaba australis IT-1]
MLLSACQSPIKELPVYYAAPADATAQEIVLNDEQTKPELTVGLSEPAGDVGVQRAPSAVGEPIEEVAQRQPERALPEPPALDSATNNDEAEPAPMAQAEDKDADLIDANRGYGLPIQLSGTPASVRRDDDLDLTYTPRQIAKAEPPPLPTPASAQAEAPARALQTPDPYLSETDSMLRDFPLSSEMPATSTHTRAPSKRPASPQVASAAKSRQQESHGPKRYFVEVGSFLMSENAERLAARIRQLDIPVKHYAARVDHRIYQRVHAGPFPYKVEAEWAARVLRNKGMKSGDIIAKRL